MILIRLALKSLLSRSITVALTVFAIGLSVALLLGVEKVRTGARASFADTISDTDLIIGARSGSVQLLLYSVFRVGNATNNVSWDSYFDISNRPEIAWAVPISLGDSHLGYRVMGTTAAYFKRYRYRGSRSLEFQDGQAFDDLFDAVIGADVAAALGYRLGDPLVVAHGVASFTEHDDLPFRVAGILEKTGTPVDRTVIISLEAIEAIHVDWRSGARLPGQSTPAEVLRQMDLQPKAITAAMLGVHSKLKVFQLQRAINEYKQEPLLAILPGVALQELWEIVSVAEDALISVSVMVVATALIGMMAMIFSSLNERRREMAILRAVGARPRTVIAFLLTEALFMTLSAIVLGLTILYTIMLIFRPFIDAKFGLYLPIEPIKEDEWYLLAGVAFAGGLVSLLPAFRAYRLSLADGMTIRI
ncbi:MAG: ABC transporter permease [Hyphomicrobiaceae bacterium]